MKKLVSLLVIATCTAIVSCSPKLSPQEQASSAPTANTGSNSNSTTVGNGVSQSSTTISEFAKVPVTLAKFNSIALGSSYEQVVAALGEPSSKSTMTIANLPTTNTYQWRNPGSTFALTTLTFQDNKLTLKNQYNLK